MLKHAAKNVQHVVANQKTDLKLLFMYNKVFLFSILFFNLLQLNAQYQEIKDCINEQVNKNFYIVDCEINSKVDVFDSIEKLENYLLQNNRLKYKNQKSYQDLDKKIRPQTLHASLKCLIAHQSLQFFSF